MKAAIYCRVSTDQQNIESQEQICSDFCERKEIPVFAIYKDNGKSGMLDKRPAFNEMVKDMRRYKFDCIVVTKIDRIGRSLMHLLNLFDEFNNKGVHFIAVTQNIDTSTSVGKFQLQMLGAVAELERNLISERTKEGLKYAKNAHKIGQRGEDKKPRKRLNTLRKKIID